MDTGNLRAFAAAWTAHHQDRAHGGTLSGPAGKSDVQNPDSWFAETCGCAHGRQDSPRETSFGFRGRLEWNDQDRIATIDLPNGVPIQNQVVLTLQGAGSFANRRAVLLRSLTYRTRVRQVEVAEKLKWGMLLHGQDLKKEPFVLRETEQVEQELNDLVDSPRKFASIALTSNPGHLAYSPPSSIIRSSRIAPSPRSIRMR